jgi:putative ABC transport system permease protein
MLKTYLTLFLRNLRRHSLFSAVNLLGLTVSIASTLLIYLYVDHEFSYDRFHEHADRIYRVNQTFIWGENNSNQFASTGPGVAYAIRDELPEVELMTSIHTPGDFIVSCTDDHGQVISFEENRVLAADSNFFRMFNFPLVSGEKNTVFAQANTLVMTRSTAEKYFGGQEAVGQMVTLGGIGGQANQTYEVTGVVEDTPDNSYIEFDILLSMKGFPIERFYWSWVWTQLETYVRLAPGADVNGVREKLSRIPEKHAVQTLKLAFNQSWEEYIKAGKKWELFLQPLTQIHLPEEAVINRLNDSGNITIIYSFIGAAVFIAFLSCINFMNLSTAQFTRRIKEVSVRKVLGLRNREVRLGYFIEALSFCLVALIIALGLIQALLPAFNALTEKSLELSLFDDSRLVPGVVVLIIVMALVAGSYPALFMSRFQPAEGLKGKVRVGKRGTSFRNGLVVFQFGVSIALVLCTAIVYQQLDYVSSKDIGFARENLLVLSHAEAVKDGQTLARAAEQITGVASATWCNSVPPRIWGGDTFGVEEMSELRVPLNFTAGDEKYVSTLGLRMKLGRSFSADIPADVDRVIVNESTVRRIGWPLDETVIGKKLTYENNTFEIVGVVSDYNYWSLANPIEPMAIFHINTKRLYAEPRQFVTLRVETHDSRSLQNTISALGELWKKHAGGTPFDYYFVDDAFAETFKTQQRFGTVLTVMAALALLIAALGLLGMIVYALEQRTKEIGIRKVAGAGVWDVLLLISRGFTVLVVIAFLLAAPPAWWLMKRWLEEFTYRVEPSLYIFLATGAGTLLVAILITSYHSVRAAMTNPVEVLRDE